MRYEIDHDKKIVTFYIKDQSHEFSFDEFETFFGILFLKLGGRVDLVKAVKAYSDIVGEIAEYFKEFHILNFKNFEKIYRKYRRNIDRVKVIT